MAHQLPPLQAVRVFEAAARLLSFTKAGEELGMTQAAVSYQIKLLEERVGTPLFLRRPRQVTLTETGQRLAPTISAVFEQLADAFASLRQDVEGTLAISVVQTFAAQWLAQRLGSFQLEHPELAVRLDPSLALVDFARQEVDVAIRSGEGKWPGLISHRLLAANFTPMLSPDLAASIGGVKEPTDLLRLPILDPNDYWWGRWFETAGYPPPDLSGQRGSQFGAQTLEAAAAIASQGVAILTPAFYKAELASGRLIQPFDILGDNGRAYWLVYPESRRNVPKIRAFRDWILESINRTGA